MIGGGWNEYSIVDSVFFRADVVITAPIESAWKARNETFLKDVRWTYVATTRGAFRSYPGHRSPKNFDPRRYILFEVA